MDRDFVTYTEKLIEQHLPVAFMEYEDIVRGLRAISRKSMIARKELLIFAYIIGANVEESNELLRLSGHTPLYVKRREDAIWYFALKHRLDCASIVEKTFLQNVDALPDSE